MRTNAYSQVNRATIASVEGATASQKAGEAPAELRTPDAPRTGEVAQQASVPTSKTPASMLGAFVGRAAKAVLAATIGLTLATGITGCSTTYQPEPLTAQTAQAHTHRFAKSDQGWTVRGQAEAGAVPAKLSKILDLAAAARASDDGYTVKVVTDDARGSFTSPWNSHETRALAGAMKDLAKANGLQGVHPEIASAFLYEMADVIGEVGPTGGAAMGYGKIHMETLEKAIYALAEGAQR